MKYLVTTLFIFLLGCQNKSQQKDFTENTSETPEIVNNIQQTELPGNEPEPVIIDSTYLIHTGWEILMVGHLYDMNPTTNRWKVH